MKISEIYVSKQGEGRLTGTPSVFVRTSGCNLRCHFCDTPFTSWAPEGENQSVDEIVAEVATYDTRFVVITGGEPMLPKEIESLTDKLKSAGHHLTIETAGTIDRNVACDLMSISPKLSNSTPQQSRAGRWATRHEQNRLQLDTVRRLISLSDYQLKFVVSEKEDLQEIQWFCDQLPDIERNKVLLMPEGVNPAVLKQRAEWMESFCQQYGFSFCQRMHIFWYGNKRGT